VAVESGLAEEFAVDICEPHVIATIAAWQRGANRSPTVCVLWASPKF
jgi:hypothetical protein